jgi:predicted aspartyl protease
MTGPLGFCAGVLAMLCAGVAPMAQATGPELPAGIVRIAMSAVEGQIVVPVHIDGQGPFAFRLDTGSSVGLTIDPRLAEQVGLQFERLDLGGAAFRDVTAVQATLPDGGQGVLGVLGFPFFREVLLTIDYAGLAVELRHGSLSSDAEGVVALVGATGTPQITMQVGDRVFLARIDTGFADNVALPLAAAGELGTESAPAAVGSVQAEGRTLEARSARLVQPLLVAGRRYDRLPVIFVDLESGPCLGYGLLAYFTLTFDQVAGLVRITAASATG